MGHKRDKNKHKLGRNDLCPCGSGKKFKKCHGCSNFSDKSHIKETLLERPAKVPIGALEHKIKKVWDRKICLHPLAGETCDKIIRAHTVQRSRVLSSIVDHTNHVYTFYPIRREGTERLKLRKIGWRDAATFTGFCAKHDGETFRTLEVEKFKGSTKQCFLVGYRAVCHEVYQKAGAKQALHFLQNQLPKGASHDEKSFQAIQAGNEKGLREFSLLKEDMDKTLIEHTYGKWSHLLVTFDGPLCLASSGMVSPNRDISGNELQVLHDPKTAIESAALGIVTTDTGGAFVAVWKESHDIPHRFFESLIKAGHQHLGTLLAQFILLHVENTYFSAEWWNRLDKDRQKYVMALVGDVHPYYSNRRFERIPLVPWQIKAVTLERGGV